MAATATTREVSIANRSFHPKGFVGKTSPLAVIVAAEKSGWPHHPARPLQLARITQWGLSGAPFGPEGAVVEKTEVVLSLGQSLMETGARCWVTSWEQIASLIVAAAGWRRPVSIPFP